MSATIDKCQQGHQMTPDNTDKRGRCRQCMREYGRIRYAADPQRQRQATLKWRAKDPAVTAAKDRAYAERYLSKPGIRERDNARSRSRRRDPAKLAATKQYAREYRARWRRLALAAYGNACACCGSRRAQHLVIDHIAGGGNAHRRELVASSLSVERWLHDEGYPAGFQILCHNCNFEKHAYHRCGCQDGLPQSTEEVIEGARTA